MTLDFPQYSLSVILVPNGAGTVRLMEIKGKNKSKLGMRAGATFPSFDDMVAKITKIAEQKGLTSDNHVATA